MFLYGILFSFVLFIKANYALFFLTILTFRIIELKNKTLKSLLLHIIYGVAGIIVGAIPAFMYAFLHNCIGEMIYNTFALNFVYSKAPYPGLNTKLDSILYTLSEFKMFLLIAYLLMIITYCIGRRDNDFKNASRFICVSFLLVVLSILVSTRPYEYYLIMLLPYICLFVFYIFKSILERYFAANSVYICALRVFVIVSISVGMCLTCYFKSFMPMIENGKSHERVARFVKENISNKRFRVGKRDELFVLGSALYIYTGCDILPNFKYFCLPAIDTGVYSVPFDETISYLKNRSADIVAFFTRDKYLLEYLDRNGFAQIMEENYDILASGNGVTVFQAK